MTGFTHSLAVLIGIDAYGRGIPPLTTAVNEHDAVGRDDCGGPPMTITDYRNFDLLIARAGDRYRAFVVDAPAGRGQRPLRPALRAG